MDEPRQEDLFSEEDFAAGGESAPAPEPEKGHGGDYPWLELAERFPDFEEKCRGEEFMQAVKAGERPVEAYMRLENQRLERECALLRQEMLLRDRTLGAAASTAAESPEDPFIEGLSYMR